MSDDDANVSYLPSEGLSYDTADPIYWDSEKLQLEITRAFEICHGCRMCFKFCDSFPTLFSLLDEKHDGNVKRLSLTETERVVDACFQCKLCEVQCPYTPRDGHEFQLDFPKLMHRYQAVRHRYDEPPLREKLLGDPDRVAKMARLGPALANGLNRVAAHRWFMEQAMGIHREKQLPDFAPESFEDWAVKTRQTRDEPPAEAVLFQTCYVQNNEPEIGKDTVEVMKRNQVDIACAKGLVCCGMPAWEHGDLETLRRNAKRNLVVLLPFVEQGARVLAINPTCSMMLRREYPELLTGHEREPAKRLASAVMDPGEFLWSIRKEERFNDDFRSSPVSVAYHAPCHLRAQAVGFKGRDLMKKIPGVKPSTVLECCGHDGTYGFKAETYESSIRVGKKSFEGMQKGEHEVWATECPLAAIQFEQHAGKKALHPMTVLARAYREDGFPHRLPPRDGEGS